LANITIGALIKDWR